MNARIQPFALGTEFAVSRGAPRTMADLEAEVGRLQAEIRLAEESGRRAGAAEALSRLRAERDSALAAATETVALAIAGLQMRFEQTEKVVARVAAELALDMADHLAGVAIARDPALGVEAALRSLLSKLRERRPVVVRIAPTLITDLAERFKDASGTLISWQGDDSLPLGDAQIEWDSGSLLLDRSRRRAELLEEIAATLAA